MGFQLRRQLAPAGTSRRSEPEGAARARHA
jgi:hypothetical protein